MKELGDLRQTLDGLLKKLSNKNLTYDSMVRHLDKEAKYLTSIGECALNYQEKKFVRSVILLKWYTKIYNTF